MAREDDNDAVTLSVSLTARVPAVEGAGGYDLTCEDGQVTIKKVGASNRTPTISYDDLVRAVEALKG